MLITITCFSQGFINKSQEKVVKILSEDYKNKSINFNLQQTDSTIILLVRDPKVQNLDIQFHFDKEGKCDRERYTLSCDSCYSKFLNGVLNKKEYNWVKVNEHTYSSKIAYKLLLSLEPRIPFTYSIQRSALSKKGYKKMFRPENK